MTWNELMISVVPTGRTFLWVGSICISMFLAGVGFVTHVRALTSLPSQVEVISASVEVLEDRQAMQILATDSLRFGLKRIVCLSRLSAIGQVIDPLDIDRLCP